MSHDALNAQTAINAPIDGEEIYQLVKRSDINPHEVEDAATQQIEVSVLWERSILHVAHLENGRSFVWYTTELEELTNCERIYVFREGRAATTLQGEAIETGRILQASFGGEHV